MTFTATGTAGAATQIALNAGNAQSATVNTAVATAPSVIVRDAFNNPVQSVSVTFAPAGGGGSVTGGSASTGSNGIATVGSWTLGTSTGGNSLSATSTGLAGSPVSFTATGTADAPAVVNIFSGDNQSATVHTAVATAPSVFVTDQFGNRVPSVTVTFAVATGGGSVTGGTQTSDGSGFATVGSWTLGDVVGANTLTGHRRHRPCDVHGDRHRRRGDPDRGQRGNNQSATVNTTVTTAPSVIVRDQFNNLVQGVSVTFAVASGAGSLTGGSATTGSNGIATVGSWTLGQTAGANTLTATSTGLTGSPVTFTATGTAGAATQIAVNAGDTSRRPSTPPSPRRRR